MRNSQLESVQWSVDVSHNAETDPLMDCLVLLTEHFGNPCSANSLSAGLPLKRKHLSPDLFAQAAARAGLSAKLVKKGLDELPNMLLPCVLLLKDRKAVILQELNVEENSAVVTLPETGGEERLSIEELESLYVGFLLLIKQQYRGDKNFDVHINTSNEYWLTSKIKSAFSIYKDVIVASVIINLFALIMPLFIMNIYDKVVPNLAFETLWVLSVGVILAFIFDFVLKQLRSYLVDVASKKIDIDVSSQLFSKVIGIPLERKSASVGGMAKQVGEFEYIREFISSATINALVDFPFSLLIMGCIWLVAGDLVLFPLLAAILIIGFTLMNQPKLKRAIEESNKFSGLKHGHLVECLTSIEPIKSNGAEGVVQSAWQQMVGHTANWSVKTKIVTNSVLNFAGLVAQLAVVGIVILGVYRLSENLVTMGGIIASVMLSSRAIQPFNKLASLLVRANQVRSSLRQLDALMEQKGEFDDKGQLVSRPKLAGDVEADSISFKYPNTDTLILNEVSLRISEGEKVAIVGHNGSGKTTLAKLLLGLYKPQSGSLKFDGLNSLQIHPSDIRRNFGYVPQDINLFHGTIRDNILFGTRQVTEYQLIRAVKLSGVGLFTDHNTEGLDKQVGEGGAALSRGQRQSVALARAILTSPQLLLLDEPTASLDARSEKQFIQSINTTAKDRTLILITHKMELLSLVDRVVVLDKGKVLFDGPKNEVIAKLQSGTNATGHRS